MTMLTLRAIVFTVLAPGVVAGYLPWAVDQDRVLHGSGNAGWLVVAAGGAVYVLCLLRFLTAGGTPAIFFSRPLRFLIGEAPRALIQSGLYESSRNPMYLGVLLIIVGQAQIFASSAIALYAAGAALFFHLVVLLLEEPWLRSEQGQAYEDYCRRVPRWI